MTETLTNASPIAWLDELTTVNDEMVCEATTLGIPCQRPAKWQLVMNCGHRSGVMCDPCRLLFIEILRGEEYDIYVCKICGFEMWSPDDVRWLPL